MKFIRNSGTSATIPYGKNITNIVNNIILASQNTPTFNWSFVSGMSMGNFVPPLTPYIIFPHTIQYLLVFYC